jgi:hypothetical protein
MREGENAKRLASTLRLTGRDQIKTDNNSLLVGFLRVLKRTANQKFDGSRLRVSA